MKVLIDIGHPAHVHLFRNVATDFQDQGAEVLFTARQKDMTFNLLEGYGFSFISMGKPKTGLINKLWGMIKFNAQLLKIAYQFKPDVLLSHGSIYAAHVSAIIGKPHISLEDTGNMEQIALYKPFTKAILVSDSFKKNLGKKMVKYSGYHELAYLHPQRFTPDVHVLEKYGFSKNETLILMRFVSWEASHDVSHKGISRELKEKAVNTFSKYGRVIITSEKSVDQFFRPYLLKINPLDIFHIMAHCSLVFGESGTMASEAAMLGVSAIYIDSTSRDYTQDLEKRYSLVYNYSEDSKSIESAIERGVEILENPKAHKQFQEKQKLMLSEKIDPTDFIVNYIQKSINT